MQQNELYSALDSLDSDRVFVEVALDFLYQMEDTLDPAANLIIKKSSILLEAWLSRHRGFIEALDIELASFASLSDRN